jgi:hypothetical protein
MSANVATFKDYKPAYLKRSLQRTSTEPRAESIISDMADGILATEFFFSFAGFKHAESKLIFTIIGILGDGEERIELYDEDIAKIAECDVRTVQRWRADYLKQAQAKNYFPLAVVQGEYDHTKQRYHPTTYRITFAGALERTVAAARASRDYQSDRLRAIEEAANLYYEDIEQAPPKMRTRKRGRTIQTPLAHLNKAAKKLTATQTSLNEMPDFQRAAFINGQGEELRTVVEAMRQQLAELEASLSCENSSVANKEVEIHTTSLSGIPPDVENAQVDVVDKEEYTTTSAVPGKREHTTEDFAAFDSICSVFRQPTVTRTDVVIESHAPPEPPPPELEYIADDSCAAPEEREWVTI